jgi:hypothetical protein
MATTTLAYECAACHVGFDVTVSDLTDPRELSSVRDRRDLDAELLEGFGRAELRYATCPACSARNPQGVALELREARATHFGGGAAFGAVAIAAYFIPPIALLVPLLMIAIFVAMVVTVARARPTTRPWARVLLQGAIPPSVGAAIVALPRFAFVVPLLQAIWFVLTIRKATSTRFEQAAARLRFHASPYREPGIQSEPTSEQPRLG